MKNNRMLGLISQKYIGKSSISEIRIEEMNNCVYFITDGEYLKIGSASSLPNRIKQLQTGNARKLKVLYVIACKTQNESMGIETILHKKFKENNVLGEWFKIDLDTIERNVFRLGYKLQIPTSRFNFYVDGIKIVS